MHERRKDFFFNNSNTVVRNEAETNSLVFRVKQER